MQAGIHLFCSSDQDPVATRFCVSLAAVVEHLCDRRFGTDVPQPRRSGPQHLLADAQPSRRQRLPVRGGRKGGREEGVRERIGGQPVGSKATRGTSPEGHLFQQVSIHLLGRTTLCVGLLLHRRREEGGGAGMREEVGGILRLWAGQDYRLLGGKDEAKNRQLNKFDGGFYRLRSIT